MRRRLTDFRSVAIVRFCRPQGNRLAGTPVDDTEHDCKQYCDTFAASMAVVVASGKLANGPRRRHRAATSATNYIRVAIQARKITACGPLCGSVDGLVWREALVARGFRKGEGPLAL